MAEVAELELTVLAVVLVVCFACSAEFFEVAELLVSEVAVLVVWEFECELLLISVAELLFVELERLLLELVVESLTRSELSA